MSKIFFIKKINVQAFLNEIQFSRNKIFGFQAFLLKLTLLTTSCYLVVLKEYLCRPNLKFFNEYI